MSEANTELPDDLRNNMLRLCNFVDKRTVEILADPKPQLLDVLININRNIAAGMLSDTNTESAPADSNVSEPIPAPVGGLTA